MTINTKSGLDIPVIIRRLKPLLQEQSRPTPTEFIKSAVNPDLVEEVGPALSTAPTD